MMGERTVMQETLFGRSNGSPPALTRLQLYCVP